jgi:Mg2+/Co2+ transporter CorB
MQSRMTRYILAVLSIFNVFSILIIFTFTLFAARKNPDYGLVPGLTFLLIIYFLLTIVIIIIAKKFMPSRASTNKKKVTLSKSLLIIHRFMIFVALSFFILWISGMVYFALEYKATIPRCENDQPRRYYLRNITYTRHVEVSLGTYARAYVLSTSLFCGLLVLFNSMLFRQLLSKKQQK